LAAHGGEDGGVVRPRVDVDGADELEGPGAGVDAREVVLVAGRAGRLVVKAAR
jgi:hypothetical protein